MVSCLVAIIQILKWVDTILYLHLHLNACLNVFHIFVDPVQIVRDTDYKT